MLSKNAFKCDLLEKNLLCKKPIKCDLCEQRFSQSSKLNKHKLLKKDYKMTCVNEDSHNPVLSKNISKLLGKMPIKCDKCKKIIPHQSDLNKPEFLI